MKLFSVRYRVNGYGCYSEAETFNNAVELVEYLFKKGLTEKAVVVFRDKFGNEIKDEFRKGDNMFDEYI